MLAIEAEFLLGSFRADPDGLARTGQQTRGEWPPAPIRLFAALVSADGTGERCRVTTGAELDVLEQADPPLVFADGDDNVHHQPQLPRYVVKQSGNAVKSTQQEYVGRIAAQVRPAVRVAPRNSVVRYLWDIDVDDDVLEGLRLRAARVGYLGTADSPVRLTVSRTDADDIDVSAAYCPDVDGELLVGVPRPGVLAAMDAHYEQWVERGPDVSRSQFPGIRRQARYRAPGGHVEAIEEPTVIWLRLDSPISGRRVMSVTTAFRAAVLSRFQSLVGDPPALLHGHGIDGKGFHLARFLALPDVGGPHSRQRIHGLALWLPKEAAQETIDACRLAVGGVWELHGTGFSSGVQPWTGEERPWAANPARWIGPSRRWATAFPALFERRTRRLSLPDVAAWCEHADLPSPVAMRTERGPFLQRGVDLAPSEVNRPDRPRLPYGHVEIIFEEEVRGPVVLGAGRSLGLGLCAPIAE